MERKDRSAKIITHHMRSKKTGKITQDMSRATYTVSRKKGSVLVFSLLILSLVTVMAIGIASSTVISRKASDATGKSAKAFQVADTGLERVLHAMYKNLQADDSINDLAADISATCNGGKVELTTSDESWHATFHDEQEPSGANQMACAAQLIDVVSIKVVGTYLGVTRAIDVRPSGYLYRGLLFHGEFEDGSGTIAKDSSPRDNDGTLVNMDDNDWVGGKIGEALEFDGSNDYVRLPDIEDRPKSTITFWLRPKSTFNSSTVATQGLWNKFQNAAINATISLRGTDYYPSPPFGPLGVGDNGGGGPGTITTKIEGGGSGFYLTTVRNSWEGDTWYHIAFVWGDSNAKLYVNGVEDNALTIGSAVKLEGNGNDEFGRSAYDGVPIQGQIRYFDGTLDDFRIYDRALSDVEICKLYTLGGGTCP